ncbi:hypothetical protein SATMO3_15310 [Sporomusa aerivorans]
MSINLNEPAVELRESRLRTITGYEGDAAQLTSRSDFPNRERSFTQCGSCSADQVMNMLTQIQDAAVVEHGPAGCAGDIPTRNGVFRLGNRRMGYNVHNVKYINTNLDEKARFTVAAPSWREPSGRPNAVLIPRPFLSQPPALPPSLAMMSPVSATPWRKNWEFR